jgi:hypothetical protein
MGDAKPRQGDSPSVKAFPCQTMRQKSESLCVDPSMPQPR